MAERDELWIFGYGSLIWRPDFPHAERRPATLRGYVRRFWQGSVDHRGTPGAPGRVVTLVPEAMGRCEGVAFRVRAAERASVLQTLDDRERGGYAREWRPLRLRGPEQTVERALVYRATPENRNYLGPESADAIAAQIQISVGPSGRNDHYLFELAGALRELGADDPHVFELEAVLARISRR